MSERTTLQASVKINKFPELKYSIDQFLSGFVESQKDFYAIKDNPWYDSEDRKINGGIMRSLEDDQYHITLSESKIHFLNYHGISVDVCFPEGRMRIAFSIREDVLKFTDVSLFEIVGEEVIGRAVRYDIFERVLKIVLSKYMDSFKVDQTLLRVLKSHKIETVSDRTYCLTIDHTLNEQDLNDVKVLKIDVGDDFTFDVIKEQILKVEEGSLLLTAQLNKFCDYYARNSVNKAVESIMDGYVTETLSHRDLLRRIHAICSDKKIMFVSVGNLKDELDIFHSVKKEENNHIKFKVVKGRKHEDSSMNLDKFLYKLPVLKDSE